MKDSDYHTTFRSRTLQQVWAEIQFFGENFYAFTSWIAGIVFSDPFLSRTLRVRDLAMSGMFVCPSVTLWHWVETNYRRIMLL